MKNLTSLNELKIRKLELKMALQQKEAILEHQVKDLISLNTIKGELKEQIIGKSDLSQLFSEAEPVKLAAKTLGLSILKLLVNKFLK